MVWVGIVLVIHPVRGPYDLYANSTEQGCWQVDLRLREGEHQTVDFVLKQSVSIEGQLLAFDGLTPHISIPVQAVKMEQANDSKLGLVSATTLSDTNGRYQLINLMPGKYPRAMPSPRWIYLSSESNNQATRFGK